MTRYMSSVTCTQVTFLLSATTDDLPQVKVREHTQIKYAIHFFKVLNELLHSQVIFSVNTFATQVFILMTTFSST